MQLAGLLDQLRNTGGKAGYSTAGGEDALALTIGNVISVLLSILGLVFLVLLVYGGYIWMIARGNEDQVTHAKDTIKNATIGLLITLAAYSISYFVVGGIIEATSK